MAATATFDKHLEGFLRRSVRRQRNDEVFCYQRLRVLADIILNEDISP